MPPTAPVLRVNAAATPEERQQVVLDWMRERHLRVLAAQFDVRVKPCGMIVFFCQRGVKCKHGRKGTITIGANVSLAHNADQALGTDFRLLRKMEQLVAHLHPALCGGTTTTSPRRSSSSQQGSQIDQLLEAVLSDNGDDDEENDGAHHVSSGPCAECCVDVVACLDFVAKARKSCPECKVYVGARNELLRAINTHFQPVNVTPLRVSEIHEQMARVCPAFLHLAYITVIYVKGVRYLNLCCRHPGKCTRPRREIKRLRDEMLSYKSDYIDVERRSVRLASLMKLVVQHYMTSHAETDDVSCCEFDTARQQVNPHVKNLHLMSDNVSPRQVNVDLVSRLVERVQHAINEDARLMAIRGALEPARTPTAFTAGQIVDALTRHRCEQHRRDINTAPTDFLQFVRPVLLYAHRFEGIRVANPTHTQQKFSPWLFKELQHDVRMKALAGGDRHHFSAADCTADLCLVLRAMWPELVVAGSMTLMSVTGQMFTEDLDEGKLRLPMRKGSTRVHRFKDQLLGLVQRIRDDNDCHESMSYENAVYPRETALDDETEVEAVNRARRLREFGVRMWIVYAAAGRASRAFTQCAEELLARSLRLEDKGGPCSNFPADVNDDTDIGCCYILTVDVDMNNVAGEVDEFLQLVRWKSKIGKVADRGLRQWFSSEEDGNDDNENDELNNNISTGHHRDPLTEVSAYPPHANNAPSLWANVCGMCLEQTATVQSTADIDFESICHLLSSTLSRQRAILVAILKRRVMDEQEALDLLQTLRRGGLAMFGCKIVPLFAFGRHHRRAEDGGRSVQMGDEALFVDTVCGYVCAWLRRAFGLFGKNRNVNRSENGAETVGSNSMYVKNNGGRITANFSSHNASFLVYALIADDPKFEQQRSDDGGDDGEDDDDAWIDARENRVLDILCQLRVVVQEEWRKERGFRRASGSAAGSNGSDGDDYETDDDDDDDQDDDDSNYESSSSEGDDDGEDGDDGDEVFDDSDGADASDSSESSDVVVVPIPVVPRRRGRPRKNG